MLVNIEITSEHLKAASELGMTSAELTADVLANARRRLDKMVARAKVPITEKKTIDQLKAIK
jgi:hypothetical protein